ncbi:MAG TPA: radical SAM protein, partial [Bacteroidales bacterium]|nr:radical SAM protein [Bacteroidales bacterium]
MYFSKHNILSRIKDSDSFFILNPLLQQADIITADEVKKIVAHDYSLPALAEKKYILPIEEESKLYRQKYLEFIDTRETDEVQLFFVPWYTCNFACSYCFQDEYTNPNNISSPELIDSFFSYIQTAFAGRQKYITIFGGEPLLPGAQYKEIISTIIHKATEQHMDIAIVTNGYHIVDYIDILQTGHIREIQVTLDGMQHMHDSRRMLRGGKPSFNTIVAGIDKLLEYKIPVNLRMVVDKENIQELPKLAQFAID